MRGVGVAVRKGRDMRQREGWGREAWGPGSPPRPDLKSFHSIKAPHSGSSCVPGLAAIAG